MQEMTVTTRIPQRGSSLDEAEQIVRQFFYKAGLLFERMEGQQLVQCNGHHQAQAIAEDAVRRLREVWGLRKDVFQDFTKD